MHAIGVVFGKNLFLEVAVLIYVLPALAFYGERENTSVGSLICDISPFCFCFFFLHVSIQHVPRSSPDKDLAVS